MRKLHRVILIILAIVLELSMTSCGNTSESKVTPVPPIETTLTTIDTVKPDKVSFLIGMSQCNLGEPWRVAMNEQIEAEAEKHPELKVIFSDAAQDNNKQVADVENFIQQKVDLLIISPNEAAPLTAVVKRAFDAGIPVIILDRKIEGDSYTSFIGGDNKLIGKKAGEFVVRLLGKKGGNVIEIKGLEGATPQQERHDGFMEGIKSNPNIKVIASQNADWLRDKAITAMETMLQENKKIDVVYAHNDPSAEGAYTAAVNAKREGQMKFIGIDALPTPDGGINSVIDGRIAVTFVYPTGGKEAIESAYKLLVKGEKLERSVTLNTIEITKDNAKEIYEQFKGK